MLERLFVHTRLMENSLDAAWLRNEAIAQNIANVDTPGYKRKTVAFEEYLNDASKMTRLTGNRTDRRHIPIGETAKIPKPAVSENGKNLSMRIDGNNVDIDSEMADMAKNTIKYNTLIQSMNAEFKKLKSVISEGRK